MPIAPALQRFVDDELDRTPALIERTLAGTLQLLRDTKDPPLAGAERSQQLTVAEALASRTAECQRAFTQALVASVKASLMEQAGDAVPGPPQASSGLELMDESRVETDIEISRAMQLIDTAAEWELRELQTFTSTLIGRTHVSADSNPFRPLVYATALWEMTGAVSAVPLHRHLLLRVSAGVAAGLLKKAWAAASTRLEAQGVEPGIYRTVLLAPGSTPGRGTSATNSFRPGVLAHLLAGMPTGAGDVQVGVGQAAVAMGSPGRPSSEEHALSPDFERALARLDDVVRALPSAAGTSDGPASALAERLGPHRSALVACAAAPGDRQIIELVSRLFDAILVDAHLPEAFVPLVARLQTTALRVALRDHDLLVSAEHALWRLLDRVGESAAAYPQPGDPRANALLAFCRTLVEEISHNTAPDATLCGRACVRLDAFLHQQLQQQLREGQAALQSLKAAERREVLEQQLRQRLVDQMVTLRTTPTMRRFVTGAWAQVLAASMQNDGEQAESTRGYIRLVDELLWSLQLPDHPRSRQRLVVLLPGLLQRLRSGMALIGMPPAEQATVLDELMTIHTEALRPGARPETASLTSQQIVQRMRDEVLPPTTGHGGFGDSVIDLGSMETVPAELMTDASPEGPAQRVESLRESDRLRLFLHGRWSRVQVLWRSDRSLLFAGEAPQRTHSVTMRALERLNSAGLMQPFETGTLVQRALDNVTRELVRLDRGGAVG